MDLTAPARRSPDEEPVREDAATGPSLAGEGGPPGEGDARPEGGAEPDRDHGPEAATATLEREAAPAGGADAARVDAAPAPAAPPGRAALREWIKEHDERWLFVVIYLGLAVGLSVFVSLFWLVAVAGLHLVLELVRQAHYRDGKANVFLHALWEIKLDVGLVLLALMLVLYIEVVLGLLGVQSAARAAAVTRAGARLGSRAAAWERNLRTFLLTVDEMVRIVYAGVMLRRRSRTPEEQAEAALARTGSDEGAEATLEAAAREAEKGAERRRKAEKAAARHEKVEALMRRRHEAAERKRAARAASVEGDETLRPLAAWRQPWGMADRIGVALVVIGVLLIAAAPWVTPHDWATAAAALLGELRPFPH